MADDTVRGAEADPDDDEFDDEDFDDEDLDVDDDEDIEDFA